LHSFLISQNSFDKWQVVVFLSSKECCAKPRNVSTNRTRGIALCCLQKSLAISKGFDVSGLELNNFI
jgi:hypothetical protein